MATRSTLHPRTAALLVAAFALGACAESPAGPAPESSALTLVAPASVLLTSDEVLANQTYWKGQAYVCKNGSTAEFSVTVNGGTPELFQINSGSCKLVSIYFGDGTTFDDVVVTEIPPAGTYLQSIQKYVSDGSTLTKLADITGTLTAGGSIGKNNGLVLIFNNGDTPPPPPPPPPGGGQGCTPGYWKQSQHFDSWTAPYTPSTLFSDVFENAFPGKTLLQVLGQGGGGLNALGRHTVAALLNTASANVSYDMTTAGVISAFNAAFPGSDYQTLKDRLEGFNESGCPLN